MENEEFKSRKITEILKAEKKAVTEESFSSLEFTAEAEERDECGFFYMKVAAEKTGALISDGDGISETFCIPYDSDSKKIIDFTIELSKEKIETQEDFDSFTEESSLRGFWTFGKTERERIMKTGKISGKTLRNENWDSYRYIGEGALENIPLKEIALPEKLVGIGGRAFKKSALKEIWIPDTTETIGREAFEGCASLRRVSIPENASVMEGAFKGCKIKSVCTSEFFVQDGIAYQNGTALYIADKSISVVKIAAGTKKIKEGAFSDERKITKAIFPEGLREIGKDAFRNCIRLKSVSFSSSITAIGASAFQSCQKLKTANLPEKLLGIGVRSFEGCSKLRKVTAGEGLSFIKREAFANCTNLKTLILPENIDEIDGSAFEGCTSLKKTGPLGN